MNTTNKALVFIILICVLSIIYILLDSNSSSEIAFKENDLGKLIIYKSDNQIEEFSHEQFRIIGEDNTVYVSLETILNNFDTNIHYDEEDKIVVITTLQDVIRFYGSTNTVKINQEITDDLSPLVFIEEQSFIPVSEIEDYTRISSVFVEDTNRVILKSQYDGETVGRVSINDAKLYSEKSIWSAVKDTIKINDSINIIQENAKWNKIVTEKGLIGYIKTSSIKDIKKISGIEKEKGSPIWKPENEKIILTWEHVYSRNPDTSKIGEMDGLNVISPTWLSLKNSKGDINSNVSKDYISWAKGRGYKVWVLFSNSFDPDLTNEFLSDSVAREKTINKLLEIVTENEMDGLNIDFENVYLKDKEILVQFVRELTPIFHDKNLVVSMDVTVKGGSENWSLFYDRKALGEVVDYIALMTYDEHWSTSPLSGSVASIGWVERGVQGLLEDVPKEKLLLGIPFYTRLWIEKPSKEVANKMEVKSKALSMESVNKILQREDIITVWDDKSGQEYLVYIEDGINKIWIEDYRSIGLKTNLVNKYDLAGVATWRRGFETEDIWSVIESTLK